MNVVNDLSCLVNIPPVCPQLLHPDQLCQEEGSVSKAVTVLTLAISPDLGGGPHRPVPHLPHDETTYREEVGALEKWCQDNSRSLNNNKTKGMVFDFRKCKGRDHTPVGWGLRWKRVASFKHLGVQRGPLLDHAKHCSYKGSPQKESPLRRYGLGSSAPSTEASLRAP